MTLEEQLQMATTTVAESTQPVTTAEVQTQTVAPAPVNEANIQAAAQVVQPTTTAMPQPVQGVQTIQMNQPTVNSFGSGIEQIQFGQPINVSPIEVVKKMEIGSVMRFTVLNTTNVFMAKTHYTEALGRFACFSTDHSARCCEDLGEPKMRFCIPIMIYPTMPNNLNTLIPNAAPISKLLVLWNKDDYDVISDAITANNGDLNIDFTAKCTDGYGRLRIDVARGQSFRPQIESFIQQANQVWQQWGNTAPTKVRKNMTEQQYINQTNQVTNNPANYNNTPDNYQNYNGIY